MFRMTEDLHFRGGPYVCIYVCTYFTCRYACMYICMHILRLPVGVLWASEHRTPRREPLAALRLLSFRKKRARYCRFVTKPVYVCAIRFTVLNYAFYCRLFVTVPVYLCMRMYTCIDIRSGSYLFTHTHTHTHTEDVWLVMSQARSTTYMKGHTLTVHLYICICTLSM